MVVEEKRDGFEIRLLVGGRKWGEGKGRLQWPPRRACAGASRCWSKGVFLPGTAAEEGLGLGLWVGSWVSNKAGKVPG